MDWSEARHLEPRQRLSRALAGLTLTAVVLLGAQPAFAYTLQNYGYRSRSMGINTSSRVSSTWATPVTNAINSWSNAGVGASIAQGGAYANYMETGNYGDKFTGLYCPIYKTDSGRHRTTQFKIQLNTYYNSQGSTFMRSVVAHELGHSLGLDHEPAKSVLMNTLRNKNVIYAPQLDDKNGVLASWN